jgi:hypothetical protein
VTFQVINNANQPVSSEHFKFPVCTGDIVDGLCQISNLRFKLISGKSNGPWRIVFDVKCAEGRCTFVSNEFEVRSRRASRVKSDAAAITGESTVDALEGIGAEYKSALALLGIIKISDLASIDISTESADIVFNALKSKRAALSSTKFSEILESARRVVFDQIPRQVVVGETFEVQPWGVEECVAAELMQYKSLDDDGFGENVEGEGGEMINWQTIESMSYQSPPGNILESTFKRKQPDDDFQSYPETVQPKRHETSVEPTLFHTQQYEGLQSPTFLDPNWSLGCEQSPTSFADNQDLFSELSLTGTSEM